MKPLDRLNIYNWNYRGKKPAAPQNPHERLTKWTCKLLRIGSKWRWRLMNDSVMGAEGEGNTQREATALATVARKRLHAEEVAARLKGASK